MDRTTSPIPRRLPAILAAMLACLALFSPAAATAQEGGDMRIATREAPPFAMKGDDGRWEGLAIELWRAVADTNGYEYTFEEADLNDMIAGVAKGEYDASVGALTITQAREQDVDFSHPFYATGFGIAARKEPASYFTLIGKFFSWDFMKTLAVLIAMLTVVGVLFWLAERKRNSEEFATDAKGIGSGFWFAAVTMTTVGYGDKAPRTPAGKIVALIWMFTALLIISTITGMIASSLTADRLEGAVTGPGDLDGVSVGVVADSAGEEWLARDGIASTGFSEVSGGLQALASGEIDAFVHDDPLLRYSVGREGLADLRVLPGSFGRQDYGIALPEDSPLREDVNIALLSHIESDRWLAHITQQLGQTD
ncbi:transporter substrate-binding domain-containing protein [Croceicoccus pelagius]|nr:transporter substrate-binding domain-containing protein [Croceicoccus pelagius]